MKVYLVIEDWSMDSGECGVDVEVYATRERAVKRLAERAEEIKRSKHYKEIDYEPADYIDAYMDRWYNDEHDHVYIKESEVR